MRFKDSLLGFAIGDAIGVPVEFQGRETLKNNPILDMEEYGTHYQPIGTWSDDTSMTIATIDSIITKNNIDYNDIMNNFNLWVREAKYTATDKCFDVGDTCRCAIYNFNGNNALECGRNEIMANGNGSLMRILPIVYYCYYYKMSDLEIYDYIKKISSLTHAHEISVLGCYIYTKYIINLLDGFDKFESYKLLSKCDYSMFNNESLCVYDRILKKEIHKYKLKEIKSSGYIVDTLEAVLWTILNTKNYKDSILTSVNMGNDTDTVGAITGSIAGLIYGLDNIPNKWMENLKKKDYLIELSDNYETFLNKFKKIYKYIRKYDSDSFNYYYNKKDNQIQLIKLLDEDNKYYITSNSDSKEKAVLYLKASMDSDVTAFSAYMNYGLPFKNIKENSEIKSFIFISEFIAQKIYFPMISSELQNNITKDIEKFYSDKNQQLKWNFTILHPICLEIDIEKLSIKYRSLNEFDDDVIEQFASSELMNFRAYDFFEKVKNLKKEIAENEKKDCNEQNKALEGENMNSEIKEKMKNIDGNIIVNGDIKSGKTTNLIFNTIDSIVDKNESLLVVDSKEEYLNNYFTKLKEKGYNIIILNLRDLDKSVGWNPLEHPYSLYKNGNKDKAIEEIQNIGNIIFREDVGTDPFWCKTSADFFTGITLGLFEDGKNEEINFNSINGMFNGMDSKYGLEDYTTNYFKLKGATSSAYNFASSTFLAPRETKGSILSVARQKLRLLTSREKLSILLSNTNFDMKEIVNKPTALFVINKDENTYINLVATLFIEQVYNYLFDIKEKNRFNFILDNFDSLSNFNDLASMIGAGIPRNMRFVIGTRYKEKLLSTFGDYILKLVTNIDVKSNNIEITRNGEKNSYSYEPIYVNISNSDITYPTLNINQINTFDVIKYVQEKKGECLFDSIDNNKLPIPPISNDLPPVPNVDELIKSIDKKIEELTLEEETEKLFNNNDNYFKSDLEQFKTE